MRIAVTGATGFIGGHVMAVAAMRGHRVIALVRSADKFASVADAMDVAKPDSVVGDMADAAAVAQAVEGVDAVVHCAATVSLDPKDGRSMADANEAGARTVIGAAAAAGVRRIVYLSSTSALFDPGRVATGRGRLTVDDPPTAAGFPYAQAKARAETVARMFASDGAPVSIVYPSAVIGPPAGAAFGEAGEGMAEFMTSGVMPTRDASLSIIDVRDLAEVILALCDPATAPQRVMCTGTQLDMHEMAAVYGELTGRNFPVLPVPASLLRGTGRALDVIRQRVSFESPLTEEGMTVLTQWQGADNTDLAALGVSLRPVAETLRDAMFAWRDAGLVTDKQIGTLAARR